MFRFIKAIGWFVFKAIYTFHRVYPFLFGGILPLSWLYSNTFSLSLFLSTARRFSVPASSSISLLKDWSALSCGYCSTITRSRERGDVISLAASIFSPTLFAPPSFALASAMLVNTSFSWLSLPLTVLTRFGIRFLVLRSRF